MNTSLLEYLKCVDCNHEHLQLHTIESNERQQVITGYLQCEHCQACFPIIQGVLIAFRQDRLQDLLLPEEREVLSRHSVPLPSGKSSSSDGLTQGQAQTHRNWSFQWLKMDTETYEHDWGKGFEDLEKFHYYDIPIPPEEYEGKIICEASCGFGRVIKILHDKPSRYIAFDLSGAVYKAMKLFPQSEKLDVIRANIHHPPFKEAVFDILFSPRALHHTGNMDVALQRLIPLVKKGGLFAYSVYSRENNTLMWGVIEPMKRLFNRYIPRPVMLVLSNILAVFVMAIIHLLYVPLDTLHVKILPLHNFFMVWSTFSFTTIKMNVFDLLHAPYAEYISGEQISRWETQYHLAPLHKKLLHDTVWGYAARKEQ